MGKKLIVLFPGVRYGVDCPLLYYAGFQYEMAGYEKIKIESYEVEERKSLEKYAELAFKNVKRQFRKFPFNEYEDVVFASKSIGTVIAERLEDAFQIKNVTHILLTPIDLTLPLMEKHRNYRLIVTGLEDKKIDHEKLRSLCYKKELPFMEIEGVGHRLETKAGMVKNIDIIKDVTLQSSPR